MSYQTEDQNDTPQGSYWILIPLLIPAALFLLVGWLVSRTEATRATVKLSLLPAAYVISSMLAVLPFVCIGWVIALLCGSSAMANYVVGNAPELMLLSTLFGDPISVPVWHIVVYQLILWIFVVFPMNESLTNWFYRYDN
jgi:hypothetical protein